MGMGQRQVGEEKREPNSENEVMPKGGSGIGPPKPQAALPSTPMS